MHAPRRTQARSTAESRIDNIIELLRFLATVAMLRLTSLVSNNCFILTRNSSVIVGIVIVVQARFIISDGQGKYQTKLKQRMKVARCSSIDRYTERSLGRTVLEIIVEVVDHTASAKFKVHFRLPSETQRLRFLSSSPSYVSKANNEALWRPEKSQFSAVLCTSNTLCEAWFLEYRLYSPKINIYTKLWSVGESYAHITEITTVLQRIKRNLWSFASAAGVKRISTYLFTFITRPFFPSLPKSRGNGSNGGVEASSRSRRRGLMFRRCILAECFLVFYGNSRANTSSPPE